MSISPRLVLFYLFALNAFPATGVAAENPGCLITSEAGVVMERFDYAERRDSGELLDRETGLLPGLRAGFDVGCGPWKFAGSAGYQRAQLDYDGQSSGGSKLASRTLEAVREIDLIVGRKFTPSFINAFTIYGGTGYREWRRNIANSGNVSGLDEKYRWGQLIVGGNTSLYQSGPQHIGIDLRWLRMWQPKLAVVFRGLFEAPDDLRLGARNGWRIALPWKYELDTHSAFKLEPYAQGWHIARSAPGPLFRNGVSVGSFFEPASDTRLYGITFNWLHTY